MNYLREQITTIHMDKISITAIQFSKKKTFLLTMACLAFVAIGTWFIIDPPAIRIAFIESPGALTVLGYITVLFFGLISVFLVKKIFDNGPAIIIDEEGIDDRSSMFPAGYVVWKDIKDITVIDVKGQRMVALELYDPEPYLQTRSSVAKKLLNMNYKMYGAHFAISANSLEVDFETLYNMISEKLKNGKR